MDNAPPSRLAPALVLTLGMIIAAWILRGHNRYVHQPGGYRFDTVSGERERSHCEYQGVGQCTDVEWRPESTP